jgi:hypothetical protein
MLTADEQRLLRQRERRNRFGRMAVPAALLVWILFCVWLFVQVPLLANPLYVIDRLQRSDIAPGTLVTMASLLPVAIALVAVVFGIFLACAWGWARREARLLRLARRLDEPDDTQGEGWSI